MNRNIEPIHRNRILYIFLVIFIITIGAISRRYPDIFPAALGKYPGDVLWTVTVFLLSCIAFPKGSSFRIALLSLFISYIDEISQLYQAPWIGEIRNTYIGHLVLGSSFAWADMAAYTIGGLSALVLELGAFNVWRRIKTR